MKKLIFLLAIVGLAWYAMDRYEWRSGALVARQLESNSIERPDASAGHGFSSEHKVFRCDGRTRCSQMTSCDEARYFLANCPGAAMDGDRDGIPCEDQWCRGR
jgi:hypothetical protein